MIPEYDKDPKWLLEDFSEFHLHLTGGRDEMIIPFRSILNVTTHCFIPRPGPGLEWSGFLWDITWVTGVGSTKFLASDDDHADAIQLLTRSFFNEGV